MLEFIKENAVVIGAAAGGLVTGVAGTLLTGYLRKKTKAVEVVKPVEPVKPAPIEVPVASEVAGK